MHRFVKKIEQKNRCCTVDGNVSIQVNSTTHALLGELDGITHACA